MGFRTIEWVGDEGGHVRLLDQTLLPARCEYIEIRDTRALWEAIKVLRVRGAPAIGVAAAFGVVLAAQSAPSLEDARRRVAEGCEYLNSSRPTAVNLSWALRRMRAKADALPSGALGEFQRGLLAEAQAIHEEDVALCAAIGRHGAALLRDGDGVLTHCNAGALATGGAGTALAVMYEAAAQGKKLRVFADETRPLLQGARLTAWELMQNGIDVTLICDGMAAWRMKQGGIHAVITGADRIAANGDAANKIGTYGLALAARAHKIPFYIAAPYSTFDFSLASGADIPIEQRDGAEVLYTYGKQTAPAEAATWNPAFDVTPADLIAGIITERGVLRPPYGDSLAEYRERAGASDGGR